MEYIIAIVVLSVFIGLYVLVYLLNSKIEKPDNCKEIHCGLCNLNCHKRRDN